MSEIYTIEDLNETLESCLLDDMPRLAEAKYPSDLVAEIIDSCIPVYSGDLIDLLTNNCWLGEVADSGLLPEKPTAVGIIQVAVYEHLNDRAYTFLQDFSLLSVSVWEKYDDNKEPEYNYFEIIDTSEDTEDLRYDRKHIEKYFPECAEAMAAAELWHIENADKFPGETEDEIISRAWYVDGCNNQWL